MPSPETTPTAEVCSPSKPPLGCGAFGFAAFMQTGFSPGDEKMVAEKFLALGAEIERLRAGLHTIWEQHIGDCPASLGHLDDVEWAQRCHGHLRAMARRVLKGEHPHG